MTADFARWRRVAWASAGLASLALLPAAARAADPAPATVAGAPVETVVVTGRQLTVETRIDRKVYTVATDLQSTQGTVADVLAVIPSIDVDADGVVSLRGDSNVLILVDGKPSAQFAGAAAGDNLQSIPARDIERIEVITNPPAQFRADGAAGVINIITRKQRPRGFAGTLQASAGSGGRSLLGANGSYSGERLTTTLSTTYRQDFKDRTMASDLVAVDPLSGQPTDARSTIDERIRRDVPPVSLSTRYALGDHDSLGLDLARTGRAGLRTYTELNTEAVVGADPTNSVRRRSSGHDREVDGDERLDYSHRMARPGETLDVSLHHLIAQEIEHYDYANDPLIPPAPTYLNNFGFADVHETSEATLDYALPLTSTRLVKLGAALEQDDYRYDAAGYNVDSVTLVQVADPALTDDFRFRQRLAALYLSYQASSGPWSWLGGLRGELAQTRARALTTGLETGQRYARLYPSVHVDRALDDRSTVSVSVSRRVARPDPGSYDPYVDREYTPNLRSGNPDLKPQYTRAYELGYSFEDRRLAATATAYYRQNRDSATDVTQDLGNGLTLTTRTNLARNDSAGIEVTANGRLTSRLGYSASANFFYSEIDATALGTPGLQSTTGVNAKLKFDWRLTAADSAQCTVTRTDKRLTPQGYVSAVNIVNLGYRRQLAADLAGIVTLSDAFNGQRYDSHAVTPTFTRDSLRVIRGRIVWIGLTYGFGGTSKDKPPSFDYDQ
ncbi:MAG: TonB-dependent receptor [Proteobacteria bacterium]|nr:TonB-dependent receptor [Pseudomonadota bacterium]